MKKLKPEQLLEFPDLDKYLVTFEKSLVKTVKTDNTIINKSVDRIIKARRKHLRPIIMLFIASSLNRPIDEAFIQSCVAVELVHIASLVHDDIIDNASSRWGIETISQKEGVNHAIIIGDYLFAKANETAARVSQEVAEIIAKTITLLCGGEISEMNDEYNPDRTIKNLISSIEGKTASLMSASCEIAAVCIKLTSQETKSLTKYGYSFGMAFQYIDDILDFLGNDSNLGKPIGRDVVEGVYTMPVLLTLEGECKQELVKILKSNKINTTDLINLLFSSGSIDKSITIITDYIQTAKKSLNGLFNKRINEGLSDFADGYFVWAVNNVIDHKYEYQVNKILSQKGLTISKSTP